MWPFLNLACRLVAKAWINAGSASPAEEASSRSTQSGAAVFRDDACAYDKHGVGHVEVDEEGIDRPDPLPSETRNSARV